MTPVRVPEGGLETFSKLSTWSGQARGSFPSCLPTWLIHGGGVWTPHLKAQPLIYLYGVKVMQNRYSELFEEVEK